MMRQSIFLSVFLLASMSSHAADNCDWDADAADSPDFANKIGDCESDKKPPRLLDLLKRDTESTNPEILQTWGDGNADSNTGLSEVPIATGGFSQHKPGQRYAIRESYSLRRGARFEESVTLAIHRSHEKMAAYCGRGWIVERQWSMPAEETGYYYLHYNISCIATQSAIGK